MAAAEAADDEELRAALPGAPPGLPQPRRSAVSWSAGTGFCNGGERKVGRQLVDALALWESVTLPCLCSGDAMLTTMLDRTIKHSQPVHPNPATRGRGEAAPASRPAAGGWTPGMCPAAPGHSLEKGEGGVGWECIKQHPTFGCAQARTAQGWASRTGQREHGGPSMGPQQGSRPNTCAQHMCSPTKRCRPFRLSLSCSLQVDVQIWSVHACMPA